jgi:hypothetical protein
MGKRAIWFEDGLEQKLKVVHEAMKKDPVLRNLNLKWADAFKMLLRDALFWAHLDYLKEIPDNTDPVDARTALIEQYSKRRAILDEMCADYDAWVAKNAAKKKRNK